MTFEIKDPCGYVLIGFVGGVLLAWAAHALLSGRRPLRKLEGETRARLEAGVLAVLTLALFGVGAFIGGTSSEDDTNTSIYEPAVEFSAVGFVFVSIGGIAFLFAAVWRVFSYERSSSQLNAVAAMFGFVGAVMYAYGALNGTHEDAIGIACGLGLLILLPIAIALATIESRSQPAVPSRRHSRHTR